MVTTLTLIAVLILLLVLLAVCCFFIYLFATMAVLPVPFVPSNCKILPSVVDALRLTKDSVLYDLGSGDGKILLACHKSCPEATYRGIEMHFLPLYIANRAWRKLGSPANMSFRKGDFFQEDLSEATHIYTYLLPNVMDRLLPKLKKELRPGTRLVSSTFVFSGYPPTEVGDKICVYAF